MRSSTHLITIILLISSISINVCQGAEDPIAIKNSIPPSRSNIGRTLIDNNADLEMLISSHGWEGDGTSSDPYLIKGQNFSSSGLGCAFLLGNTTSFVKFEKCTFQGGRDNTWFHDMGYGLSIYNSSNIEVSECVFSNNSRSHFYCYGGENISINENAFTGDWCSINTMYCNNISVCRNMINGSACGIGAMDVNNITIVENDVRNCSYPALTTSGSDQLILNNYFHTSSVFEAVSVLSYNNLKFTRIRVERNQIIGGIGMKLNSLMNSSIISNNISSTLESISCNSCSGIIFNNNFLSNENNGVPNLDTYKASSLELFSNTMIGGGLGLGLDLPSIKTITAPQNNSVNGYPLRFLMDHEGGSETLDISRGQLILVNSSDIEVVNNGVKDSGIGLQVYGSRRLTIEDIEVRNRTYPWLRMYYSRDCLISRSNFSNIDSALDIFDCRAVNITHCQFRNNTYGIRLGESKSIVISESLFFGNTKFAITMDYSSHSNLLFNNSFVYNSGSGDVLDRFIRYPQVSDTSNEPYNRWNTTDGYGNYWREWTTPDEDGDGIVDVPFRIANDVNDIDHYPKVRSNFKVISTPVVIELTRFDNSLGLKWGPPYSHNGSTVLAYLLYRTPRFDKDHDHIRLGNGSTSYIDHSLDGSISYSYYILVENSAGKSKISNIVSGMPDISPPWIQVSSPFDEQVYGDEEIELEWSVIDNISRVSYLTCVLGYREWDHLDFSSTMNIGKLTYGWHILKFKAYDTASNCAELKIRFLVDIQAPELEITSPIDMSFHRVNSTYLKWTGNDVFKDKIQYRFRDEKDLLWTNAGNSTSVFLTGLSEGKHVFRVMAEDICNNYREEKVTFWIDTVPPVLRIRSPEYGARFNRSSVLVEWESYDNLSDMSNVEISIDGGPMFLANISGTSPYISSYWIHNLSNGIHEVRIIAFDHARNMIERSTSFEVDTTRPNLIGSGPVGVNVPISSNVWVEFSKEMDRSTVSLSYEGMDGDPTWNGNRLTIFQIGDLDIYTEYQVTVEGMDLFGNWMVPVQWEFKTEIFGTVVGKVIDGTGVPISGARVILEGTSSMYTSDIGTFSISGPDGTYEFVIEHPGFKEYRTSVILERGKLIDLSFLTLEMNEIHIEDPSDEDIEERNDQDDGMFICITASLVLVVLLVTMWVILRYKGRAPFDEE